MTDREEAQQTILAVLEGERRRLTDRLAAAERRIVAVREYCDRNDGEPWSDHVWALLDDSEKAYFGERCGHEWTDDIAQRRCDLPKGHTSGAHDWHSQNLNSEKLPLIALQCPKCDTREAWNEEAASNSGADPEWCPSCHNEGPRIGCYRPGNPNA